MATAESEAPNVAKWPDGEDRDGMEAIGTAELQRSVLHVQKVALPLYRHLFVACIQQGL